MVQALFPLTDQITEMGAVRTPYVTGKHRLFKAAIVLDQSILQADLVAVECDFTGYTAVTFSTCGPVYVDQAGGVSFDNTVAVFQDTGNTVQNNVHGGWVEDSGGNVLLVYQLAVPYPMNANLDTMNIEVVVNRFGPRNIVVVVNGVPQ